MLAERHDRRRRAARRTAGVEQDVDARTGFRQPSCGDSAGAMPDGFALVAVTRTRTHAPAPARPQAPAPGSPPWCALPVQRATAPGRRVRRWTMDRARRPRQVASRAGQSRLPHAPDRCRQQSAEQRPAISALQVEQPRDRVVRPRVCGNPINRVGRERHEPAGSNDRRGLGDASRRQARRRKPRSRFIVGSLRAEVAA